MLNAYFQRYEVLNDACYDMVDRLALAALSCVHKDHTVTLLPPDVFCSMSKFSSNDVDLFCHSSFVTWGAGKAWS